MAYGFVYILINQAMPGIVKIGCTERSPTARARELSNASGVPVEFEVYGYIEVEDHQSVEREIHEVLASCRVSENREFFRIREAAAWDVLGGYTDALARAESDALVADRDYDEYQRKIDAEYDRDQRTRQAVISAMFGNVHDWWFDMGDQGLQSVPQQVAHDVADNVIAFGRRAA